MSPAEGDHKKLINTKGNTSISKPKGIIQSDYLKLNTHAPSRFGSPKPSPLEKLKNVFKRDIGYKSPLKETRLGTVNASHVQLGAERNSFKGSVFARKTEENASGNRHSNIRSRKRLGETRLNKDYKSMNNLRIDLTKKPTELKLNSRKSSPKLVNLTQITAVSTKMPINLLGPVNHNVLHLEEKNAQLEIRVSELVLQNTQLLKKIEDLEKNLKSTKEKNKVMAIHPASN